MHVVIFIAGVACLFAVLFDAFQTIILPRRATGRFRLTRLFYLATWKPWIFFARRMHHPRRRETVLSYYGPLSLILLLVVWAGVMVVGFALVYYSLGSPFTDGPQKAGFRSDLYVSGTTLFTLGLGDVTPHLGPARELLILESGGEHLVLAPQHASAAQMIQGAVLGGGHQPRPGPFRDTHRRPPFERGQQRFLRQVLGQRHVAQHSRQARDQPGLLDAPDGQNRSMGVGGRHDRRPRHHRPQLPDSLKGRPGRPRRTRESRKFPPSLGGSPCGAA